VTEGHPVAERYLAQLTSHLGALTAADRQDVVGEIRNHIAEATAAGKPLDAVLQALGPADVLARAYAVELLLHPRGDAPRAKRSTRHLALVGLVAIGSIPTLVIVVTLGAIGVSFVVSGVAVFAAGIMGITGNLPPWIQMDVPPQFVVAIGPVLTVLGVCSLFLLMMYVRFVAKTIRQVLPA
jgi:uncharacterized membrane protein